MSLCLLSLPVNPIVCVPASPLKNSGRNFLFYIMSARWDLLHSPLIKVHRSLVSFLGSRRRRRSLESSVSSCGSKISTLLTSGLFNLLIDIRCVLRWPILEIVTVKGLYYNSLSMLRPSQLYSDSPLADKVQWVCSCSFPLLTNNSP